MTHTNLLLAVAAMEQALADALEVANSSGDTTTIERILRLVIKKEILLELLLEEEPPPSPLPDCPCSIRGNRGTGPSPKADAAISVNGGATQNGEVAYNINLCNVPCNPNVNNLVFNFRIPGSPPQIFNFVQGRATRIVACDPVANTATVEGTIHLASDGDYNFTMQITNNGQTITFSAVNQANPSDTFTATITDPSGGPVAEIEDCSG